MNVRTQTLLKTRETGKAGEILYAFVIGYVASIIGYFILSRIGLPQISSIRSDMIVLLAIGFFDVIIIALTPLLILFRMERSVSVFLGLSLPLLVNIGRTLTFWLIQGNPPLWQIMQYPNVYEMWIIASILGAGSAYLISRPPEAE